MLRTVIFPAYCQSAYRTATIAASSTKAEAATFSLRALRRNVNPAPARDTAKSTAYSHGNHT